MSPEGTIVPQRAVLVLPSTGEFDSRSYRIARTLHQRGHSVTVVARWRPGLPRDETHPVGYHILRVEASAVDGLPFPGLYRAARVLVRRIAARRTRTPYRPPEEPRTAPPAVARPAVARPAAAPPATAPTAATESDAGWAHPTATAAERGASLPRRLVEAFLRRFRIFLTVRSQTRAVLQVAPPADICHGMAYMGIPVALALRRRHGGKALYDSRDIYMAAANLAKMRGPVKALLAWMERRWARKADRVLTVNLPYAEELARRLGVSMPLVVMNCSYRFTPPDPPERRFHERLGLSSDRWVVLYQGGFQPGRGIEQLLEAVHLVPDAVLVCMGYGELEPRLRGWAAEPRNQGKMYVLPAVPPAELLAWVASADVVGSIFQPDTLNHVLSTPNKFLEAMAAGVPVIASDNPGVGPITRETGCGILVDPESPRQIGEAIHRILGGTPEERRAWRERALAAAHGTYNWETQVEGLLDEYARLTGHRW